MEDNYAPMIIVNIITKSNYLPRKKKEDEVIASDSVNCEKFNTISQCGIMHERLLRINWTRLYLFMFGRRSIAGSSTRSHTDSAYSHASGYRSYELRIHCWV